MENSAYVPNSLPPPGLVVFSQANGLPDTLRMQRPFNPQVQEVKDLHLPFSAAGFGLRHMESYSGLPAHLLHHLQPQFLHPALDPRVPFGSGAFRPLGSSLTPEIKVFPSAFAPPSKCETTTSVSPSSTKQIMYSGEDQRYSMQSRANSSSPSASVSPPIKEESSEDGTPGSERSTPEEGRGFRRKKKQLKSDPLCPVCGVTLRPGEVEMHFAQELDRLDKLSASTRIQRRLSAEPQRLALPSTTGPQGPRNIGQVNSAADGTPEGRWEIYQRVKANRQARLRAKNRKRKADEATCPVCNDRLQGSAEELNGHVETCLQKHGGVAEEDENVDVEGDSDVYEEYEWAGQRRIRTTTLLVGGFAATGMATAVTRPSPADDDIDLVVDGDDTSVYGPSQYSEADVVMTLADGVEEDKERAALRKAVISPSIGQTFPSNVTAMDVSFVDVKPASSQLHAETSPPAEQRSTELSDDEATTKSSNHVLDSLKKRIKELEVDSHLDDSFKCLICMERYKKPVISVCCWHVHCEDCWLHTLGAKKLCPQCNMITSPADLRKIYM